MLSRVVIALVLLTAVALASESYTVSVDSLNVRKGAGSGYAIVSTLKKGQTVTVLSVSNGWAKLSNGYASAQYLNKVKETKKTETKKTETKKAETKKTETAKTETKNTGAGKSAGGKGGDWPPFVKRLQDIPTFWTYPGGWPTGLIVHYNAGHDKPVETMSLAKSNKYVYLTMGRDGQLYAAFPPSKGGSHTGTFHHKTSPGIEMSGYGTLTKKSDGSFVTYFGKVVPSSEVRFGKREGSAREGYYHIYTPAQEKTLKRIVLWYKWADPNNAFSFDKVLGHDEACDQGGRPGAKMDPGHSLSMGMIKLREQLKTEYAALIKKSASEQKAYFGL